VGLDLKDGSIGCILCEYVASKDLDAARPVLLVDAGQKRPLVVHENNLRQVEVLFVATQHGRLRDMCLAFFLRRIPLELVDAPVCAGNVDVWMQVGCGCCLRLEGYHTCELDILLLVRPDWIGLV